MTDASLRSNHHVIIVLLIHYRKFSAFCEGGPFIYVIASFDTLKLMPDAFTITPIYTLVSIFRSDEKHLKSSAAATSPWG